MGNDENYENNNKESKEEEASIQNDKIFVYWVFKDILIYVECFRCSDILYNFVIYFPHQMCESFVWCLKSAGFNDQDASFAFIIYILVRFTHF